MYKTGHYGVNLFLAAIALAIGGFQPGLYVALVIVSMSRFPDVDQKIDLIEHRGITHTVVFAVTAGIVSHLSLTTLFNHLNAELGQYNESLAVIPAGDIAVFTSIGVTLGILGHIFGDTLTVGSGRFGIQPFWPVSSREVRVGLCKAKNPFWNRALFVIGATAFGLVLYARSSLTHGIGF